MIYLLISGIVALFFGLWMVISPRFFHKVSDSIDKVNFGLGKHLKVHRIILGGLLIIIAIWGILITLRFPQFKLLHTVWIIALIFGFLHMFFPNLLDVFSKYSDKIIFPTKQYFNKSYKSLGILFVLAGIFILLIVYWFR